MCATVLRPLCAFALLLSLASPMLAAKYKASDYPLRVHVVFRNGNRHYHGLGGGASTLDEVDGLGQADLFENGQARGFDFNYECGGPITPQTAFDTFMARWKKPDKEIEILMPVMGGNPGDMNACVLKVNMKPDSVYLYRNGAIAEMPIAEYKDWMIKHEYDPEHGKDHPTNLPARPAGGDVQPQ
jgi:hypothetical protein